MNSILRSFNLSGRMIFKNPLNLFLVLVPMILTLMIYVLLVVLVLNNMSYFETLFRQYVSDAEVASWWVKFLGAIFVVLIFLLMNWTFVVLAGIISAPFNSILSSRVETILLGRPMQGDRKQTLSQVFRSFRLTLVNELKKLVIIGVLVIFAFVLSVVPLLYPFGVLLFSLVMAIQFLDFTWSRHNLKFTTCMKDTIKNFFYYVPSGFAFLLLVAIPVVNVLIPAFATCYFTILWLHQNGEIS